MAIHSSILVLELPWTEEPGGLPSTALLTGKTERLHTCTLGREETCSFPLQFHGHRCAANRLAAIPLILSAVTSSLRAEEPWAENVRRLSVMVGLCTVWKDRSGHDRNFFLASPSARGKEMLTMPKYNFIFLKLSSVSPRSQVLQRTKPKPKLKSPYLTINVNSAPFQFKTISFHP